MRTAVTIVLTVVLALALAVPAFAGYGSGGKGRVYGQFHSNEARMIGGFSGDMNPGNHRGITGWTPM